jgi:MFS family permease
MNRHPPGSARHNVRLYYLYGFLMDFALWSGIWIKYLIEDRGFQLKYLLAMDLPFWLLVAVLQAPTGALADHIGRRRVLAIAGALFAITVLGFGFAASYWMLFFDYVVWSFAQSMRSGADSALIYDSLKAEGREGRYQHIIGRGFALQLAAGLLSIVIGAFLADIIGLALVVQLSAAVPLLAIVTALAMREPHIERAERHYLRGMADGMRFAWRHADVRYTILIGSVLLAGTFGPTVLVQPFLIHHSVGTALYGVYQAPLRIISIVAAILAVRVGIRMGLGRLLLMACSTIVVGYIGLTLFDRNSAFLFFALPALMMGLTRPVIDGYLNDRIPSERRATVLSIMQLCFALQVAFFEPALGFFTDDFSLTTAFFFAVCYFLVLMPPLLFLWRRAQQHATPGNALEPAGEQLATTG